MKRLFTLLAPIGVVCLTPLFGGHDAAASPRQVTCANPRREVAAASQDTFVAAAVPAVGKQGEMVAGLQSNIEHYAFVQFKIPTSIPPDAQVCEAQLELFCTAYIAVSGPGAKITKLRFSNANRNWDEDTLNWDGQVPNRIAPQWDTDLGECAEGGEFKRINAKLDSEENHELLESVQGWIDGELDNRGLVIGPTRNDNLDDHRFKFATRDGQLPPPVGRGPRIMIFFAGGATPTFTPSAVPTASNTPTPTETPVPTETPTPTDTLEPSATPTETEVPTSTPLPSDTPIASATPRLRPAYLPIGLRLAAVNEAPAQQLVSESPLRRLWHRLSVR